MTTPSPVPSTSATPTPTAIPIVVSAESVGFILRLARALHNAGFTAHRLEATLSDVSRKLGLEAQFFSTPTSIMAAFGPPDAQRTHLIRAEPGSTNLSHLAGLDRIARDVVYGTLGPVEGTRRIEALLSQPARWGARQILAAYVLVSVAVASFLHVGALDLVGAAILGLMCGSIVMRSGAHTEWIDIEEPLSAFAVATVAQLFAALTDSGAGYAMTVAGLVVLLPGMTFTTGLIELSTRHLASGTARLSGALVTFLGLGFGVALGTKLGTAAGDWLVVHHVALHIANAALPWWVEGLGVLIAPLCFTVLLQADGRQAPWIVLAAAAAYLTSRFAGRAMGEELGAFLGALTVSAGSTFIARRRDTTPIVTIVPGLLILVPGSIGLRSVTSFSQQRAVAGVETAFKVALIGVSLAAGVLAGRALTGALRRRRRGPLADEITRTAEWTVSRDWR
ncbi:MAG: threonine/serine exporter family protein [Gemmatimonadaceae bacterium]|nr:threonine/serine exporter family protein [Gemmatimonadaceae bacterium]